MDLVTCVLMKMTAVKLDTKMMEEKQKCASYLRKAVIQVIKTMELVIYAFLKAVAVQPDIKTMVERLFYAS